MLEAPLATITRVAEALLELGKVVLFHTASPIPATITAIYGEVIVCPKPMRSEHVVIRLADLIEQGG